MYTQGDSAWGSKQLGSSRLTMSGFGCLVTNVAQALTSVGYDITPGTLVDGLNRIGGFTRDGLLIWGKVTELYPQFHYNESSDGRYNVTFVQGLWGRFNHWVLRSGQGTFDPFYGSASTPGGFKETGQQRIASIDPAPPLPQPAPQPTPAPEQPARWWVNVKANGLRLREEPNTTSKIIKLLYTGNKLEVDREENGFSHVWNGGWVANQFIDRI